MERAEVKVGFTGTQSSITEPQWCSLWGLLLQLNPEHCHHGSCIGADVAFHHAAQLQGRKVVVHPPLDPKKRAGCPNPTELRPEKDYLPRNQDIVTETGVLIAMPGTATETTRSGTWSTVRYARKLGRPIYIILPNGKISQENM